MYPAFLLKTLLTRFIPALFHKTIQIISLLFETNTKIDGYKSKSQRSRIFN